MEILIVDDDFCSLKLCEVILKEYATHAEQDSRQALEIYASNKPKVVLLDCGMPFIDGFEIAEGIRKIDVNCKIIMVSATPHDQQKILDHCDAFFMKPISAARLKAAVKEILQH